MRRFTQAVKTIFFPIAKSELKIFSLFATLLFCMLFNFSVLRTLKDGLVIPLIGAEAISFLKLWLVLPSAVLFTIIYVKLSNKFNILQLFSIIVSCFVLFFAIFAFVIHPNQDIYHVSELKINTLVAALPHFKWFIKLAGKWSYVIVYILSDLWAAMLINLLFWQFANHIFTSQQAKRLYPILGMIGSMGIIFSGKVLVYFSAIENFSLTTILLFSSTSNPVELTIKLIICAVIFFSIISILLLRIIYNICQVNTAITIKDSRTSLGIIDSVKLIVNSRYIFYILMLVICYGLTINILEGPWKWKLGQLYTNPCDFINFMGKFNVWLGISSVVMTIVGGNILRVFGWTIAAYITPIMITITGALFFTFVVFGPTIATSINPVYAAVMIGAVQNILSKSSKYSVFDSTKEMAYIPLSIELKAKGKAAVEVVGYKLGKSLGAFCQSIAFTIVPDLDFNTMSFFLMIVFIIVAIIWLLDVGKLSKEYQRLNNAQDN
jgi:ADP/ATP carrier protein family